MSPRSVQSSTTEAAAAAAEIAAAAIAAATGMPHAAAGRIPTVLSFNHLQSQAESVLGLTADAAAATAAAVVQGGGAGAHGMLSLIAKLHACLPVFCE